MTVSEPILEVARERYKLQVYLITHCVYLIILQVEKLVAENKCPDGDDFVSLARGPIEYAKSFRGYVTKGYRFNTLRHDKGLRTQNSGVVLLGDTGNDMKTNFYGVLKDVLRLEYLGGNYIVLFRCDWYDVFDLRRGMNIDKFGIVSVDTQKRLKVDEPFALASQVSQVFYCTDVVNKGSWRVAVKTRSRKCFEFFEQDGDQCDIEDLEDVEEEAYQENESFPLNFATTSLTNIVNIAPTTGQKRKK